MLLHNAVHRGPGRPRGTFGSGALRRQLKAEVGNQALAQKRSKGRPSLDGIESEERQDQPVMLLGETASVLQKMLLLHAVEQSKATMLEFHSNPATAIFEQGRRKLMSARVAAPEYTEVDLQRAASIVLEGSAGLWANIFKHVHGLLQAGWKGLVIGLQRKYDETPLTLRVSETRTDSQASGADCGSPSEPAPVVTKQVAKIMQTQCEVFMVLKLLDRAGGAPKFCHLHGPLPTWLQCLPTTKAMDIVQSQQAFLDQVPGLESLAKHFKLRQHCVTTDRYPANLVAERELSQKHDHNCLHSTCNIHKLSSVEKSMGDIVSGQVSGMVAVGLSMRQAGVVQELRAILKSIFVEELQCRVGMPKCQDHRCLS